MNEIEIRQRTMPDRLAYLAGKLREGDEYREAVAVTLEALAGGVVGGDCADRLYNWKFLQAKECMDGSGPNSSERQLIGALSRVFGDCGWIDGNMGVIIAAAVTTLIPDGGGR